MENYKELYLKMMRSTKRAMKILEEAQRSCEKFCDAQGINLTELDAEGILDHPVSGCSAENDSSLESGILEKQT